MKKLEYKGLVPFLKDYVGDYYNKSAECKKSHAFNWQNKLFLEALTAFSEQIAKKQREICQSYISEAFNQELGEDIIDSLSRIDDNKLLLFAPSAITKEEDIEENWLNTKFDEGGFE